MGFVGIAAGEIFGPVVVDARCGVTRCRAPFIGEKTHARVDLVPNQELMAINFL
jgi:hypothetical protein